MSFIDIPKGHWGDVPEWKQHHISGWEERLRAAIKAQPDPAKRFDDWLGGAVREGFARWPQLSFVEQPYLGWALKVADAISAAKAALRQSIADNILNPDD